MPYEDLNECFYAMERVEDETLAYRVARAGVLSLEQMLEISPQVAHAMTTAEKHGTMPFVL